MTQTRTYECTNCGMIRKQRYSSKIEAKDLPRYILCDVKDCKKLGYEMRWIE